MDRVISLLAALVGLIALGGAILVHTNADAQRTQMAAEIAQLKLSVGLIAQQQRPATTTVGEVTASVAQQASIPSAEPPIPQAEPASALAPASSLELPAVSASSSAASSAESGADVKALQDRIAALEQMTKDQASQLQDAQSKISALPASVAAPVTTADSSASQSPTAAAIVADGPTKDCIPLGTRFMGQGGDSFPICKTKLTVKVAAVTDGVATITGPGDVVPGTLGTLGKGCNVMVFSADASGFAEMRVTCQ